MKKGQIPLLTNGFWQDERSSFLERYDFGTM